MNYKLRIRLGWRKGKEWKAGEEEKVIAEVVSAITAYLHPKRILLFGSRALGRGKRYSDFDVALEGVAMTLRMERELKK